MPGTDPELAVDPSADGDEDEPSWTDFFLPAVLLAFAMVPFTPLWDEIVQPERRGRYGAIARFLESVGPVPVAIFFAGLGGLLLWAAISGHRTQARDRAAGD